MNKEKEAIDLRYSALKDYLIDNNKKKIDMGKILFKINYNKLVLLIIKLQLLQYKLEDLKQLYDEFELELHYIIEHVLF